MTKDRARLHPDTVDERLFLQSYYKEKGSSYKQEVMQTEKRLLQRMGLEYYAYIGLVTTFKEDLYTFDIGMYIFYSFIQYNS